MILIRFEEQLDQRDRKRFLIGAHEDEPAVRAKTLNAVHHGFDRVGGVDAALSGGQGFGSSSADFGRIVLVSDPAGEVGFPNVV